MNEDHTSKVDLQLAALTRQSLREAEARAAPRPWIEPLTERRSKRRRRLVLTVVAVPVALITTAAVITATGQWKVVNLHYVDIPPDVTTLYPTQPLSRACPPDMTESLADTSISAARATAGFRVLAHDRLQPQVVQLSTCAPGVAGELGPFGFNLPEDKNAVRISYRTQSGTVAIAELPAPPGGRINLHVGRQFAVAEEDVAGQDAFVQYTASDHRRVANIVYTESGTTIFLVFIGPVDHASAVTFVSHLR